MFTKRVVFFTRPEWAFGAIHHALCKELYAYGIDADIIDWTKSYTKEEFKEFNELYDIFVTTPCSGLRVLVTDYEIPLKKIICISHGILDIRVGLELKNNFDSLLDFAAVSPVIKDFAVKSGIKRNIKIVRNGIHFDQFYSQIPDKLSSIGYAGGLHHFNVNQEKDCKRRHLVLQLAESTGLPFINHNFMNFKKMPLYYRKVDSVIVPSDESEACGLPLMESAASGRLPISAKIGILSEFDNPPGLILPLNEKGFIYEGTERIKELVSNPTKYKSMCKEAQDFAKEYYDWKFVIKDWANLFL